MAEVLLNTLWLGVSASALFICLTRARTAPVRGAQAFIALACISVLLFPVVSATDDVCAVAFAAEDSTVVKKLNEPPRITAGLHIGAFAALLHSGFSVVPGWHSLGALDLEQWNVFFAPSVEPFQGRAPPLS